MTPSLIAAVVIVLILILLGLLKAETLVKLTYACGILLWWGIGVGMLISSSVLSLGQTPEASFLGMQYQQRSDFLLNAQPTIMLISSGLLGWFFVSYSHLSLELATDAIRRRLQSLLRAVLAGGTLLISIYFALGYFQGGLYEWLFLQWDLSDYTQYFPLVALALVVVIILASSKFAIKLNFSIEDKDQTF